MEEKAKNLAIIRRLVKTKYARSIRVECPIQGCRSQPIHPKRLERHCLKSHPNIFPPTDFKQLSSWIDQNKKEGKTKLKCPFCDTKLATHQMYTHVSNCTHKPKK